MGKTITIPKHNNPFIVVINNSTYTYKAGDTLEVPDEVAEAIEDALELEPKPKKHLSKIAQRANGSILEVNESDLEGIENIASYAFAHCEGLKTITIPDSVELIENHACYGCSSLESVTMGNSITKIEAYAFDWCTRLKSVYLPKTPPALNYTNTFGNIKADCVFYCKTQASLDAYKAAPNWSTLTGTYTFVVEK